MDVIIQKDLDKPTRFSKIIYTSEEMKKAILRFKDRPVFGCIGNPKTSDVYGVKVFDNIPIEDISHEFTELEVKNGNLVGKIRVLKTPKGKVLTDMFDDVSFGIAAYAEIDADMKVSSLNIHSINVVPKYPDNLHEVVLDKEQK